MPLRTHFGTHDLLNCRFALSPAWETQQAVRLLARPGQCGWYHLPWLRRSVRTAEALRLEPLWLLMPQQGWTPDFLCPAPDGPEAVFDDEISRLRATDPAVARSEMARALACTPGAADSPLGQALLADPARAVQTVADATVRAWEELIAPHWPHLLALLEADVAFHTRRLADGGPAALFDGLHPNVSWSDGALTVRSAGDTAQTLDGEGLTLMPSVFVWPDVVGGFQPPWRPAVVYPARGIGSLWSETPEQSPEALERLLGTNRAAVLTALAEPASTTALAARLGLAPSSVSVHLSTLRRAGLLTSRRVRHQVLYERTPLGIALAAGETEPT